MKVINNKEIQAISGGNQLRITEKVIITGIPQICFNRYFEAKNLTTNISFDDLIQKVISACRETGDIGSNISFESDHQSIPLHAELV